MRKRVLHTRLNKILKGGTSVNIEIQCEDAMMSGYLNPVIHKSLKSTCKIRKQRHD